MNQAIPPSKAGVRKGLFGKGPLWLRAGIVVVVLLAGAILIFNTLGGKLRRGAKRLMDDKPKMAETHAENTDELQRQVEEYANELSDAKGTIARLQAELESGTKTPPKTGDGDLPPVTGFSSESGSELRNLRSGIPFKSEVNVGKGTLASKERVMADSYTARYTLSVRVPEPSKTLEDLQGVNPALSKLLPGLPALLEKAEVSRWYYLLYDNKTDRVKKDAIQISELLSKHNYYDCETMLNLRDPQTKQRAFLMQADMDVVSDGSDGDRLATMPDSIVNSDNYQPFTSFAWPKKTATPNPLTAGWEKRLTAANKELAAAATTSARKTALRDQIGALKRGITDMKGRSFLIADYDPFIVIPVNLLTSSDPFAPKVGDYAVVIHGEKLLPAVVGDGGPTFKVGEASLRIAKEVNPKATTYSRPESSLKVTYLVFPGSRDETKGPPDYDKWQARCEELVKGIGGLGEGVTMHHWEKLLADPAAPVPPAPTPSVVVPAGTNPPVAPTPPANPAPAPGGEVAPPPVQQTPTPPAGDGAAEKAVGE
jgi:hypothetical protein